MKDLNLIPKKYKQKKKVKLKRIRNFLAGLGIFCVLLLLIALPLAIKYTYQLKLSELEDKVKSTSGFVEKENQFRILENLVLQRENEVNLINSGRMNITKIIQRIEKSTPDNLFFINLAISKKEGNSQAILSGIAKTEEDIAVLVNRLRHDGYFGDVVIMAVSKGQGTMEDTKQNVSKDKNDLPDIILPNGFSFKVAVSIK